MGKKQDSRTSLLPDHHDKTGTTGRKCSYRSQCQLLLGRTGWLPEIASLMLAFAIFATIVVILWKYDNRPLSDWSASLSINSLISVLTSVMKTALVYTISQGISELKWTWLSAPRPLIDLERFDRASRGPLGAAALLCRPPSQMIACLGAVVTILAITIEPYAQLALQFSSRPITDPTKSAMLLRTNNYTANSSVVLGGGALDEPMANALYTGLIQPPPNASAPITYHCPTGNCTFPADVYQNSATGANFSYRSLSLCSDVQDISDSISIDYENARFFVSPNISIGPNPDRDVLFSSFTTDGPSNLPSLYSFNAIMLNSTCWQEDPSITSSCRKAFAIQASIYPCVITYGAANVSNFKLYETIVGDPTPLIRTNSGPEINEQSLVRYFSWAGDLPSSSGANCTPAHKQGVDNTIPTSQHSSGQRYVNHLISPDALDTLWYDRRCTYEFGSQTAASIQSYLKGRFFDARPEYTDKYIKNEVIGSWDDPNDTGGEIWMKRMFQNGTASLESATAYMQGLTYSMNAVIRRAGDVSNSESRNGTALVSKTVLRVDWFYFTITAAELVLAAVFMAGTMISTKKDGGGEELIEGRGLWKSSLLPLLWCGLEDSTRCSNGYVNSMEAMMKTSKTLKVSLRRKKLSLYNWKGAIEVQEVVEDEV